MNRKILHKETSRKDPKPEIFWKVFEVAEYLGFKHSTIYEWVALRLIPHFRFGRKQIRFLKSNIDQWLQAFTVKPEHEEEIEKRIKGVIIEKDEPPLDINQLVKKCIAEVKGKGYTSSQEKPDEDKGLGKEVDHGTL